METCLSAARIQAAADEEAVASEYAHISTCTACRSRVEAARQAIQSLDAALSIPVPPSLEGRVAKALEERRPGTRRGATTLRPELRRPWARPAWLSATAAAAIALIAFLILPTLDRSANPSAAEILDRSIAALTPSGTELLEYELIVTALPGWIIESGTYRIEQLIEHDGPGRWRLSRFDHSGTLLNGISEDASAGRRRAFLRLDATAYTFDFAIDRSAQLRLGALQRQYAEAAIRVIQSAAAHIVKVEESAEGKRFVIELPESAPQPGPASSPVWDLSAARVVVDGGDYHVVELSARGVYMGHPVSIGYHLLRRELRPSPSVPAAEFELPVDPTAIELREMGSAHPPRDIVTALLREVARFRQ